MPIRRIPPLFVAFLLCCPSLMSSAQTAEVRSITPPRLETANLGDEVLCHRPAREGGPLLKVEKRGHQVIAHNYGHGGSGWTLAPGSAAYVNDLFVNSPDVRRLRKHTRLTVLGSGALGLFTAYDLYQRGFRNIVIVAASFDGLTSHNAGGLLAPTAMDHAPEIQEVLNQIGFDAYRFYESIANGEHPDFAQGARVMPVYFRNRENGLKPYVGVVMDEPKDVILDFGNGTQREMVAYDDGIFIDAGNLLVQLQAFLRAHGVRFKKKWVESFAQAGGRYVFNCTGLGSAKLNNDQALTPVQGHLMLLREQDPQAMEYMIVMPLDQGQASSGLPIRRFFYQFPKHIPGTSTQHVGVIGGTMITGATSETPHLEEFDIMMAGAREFYGLTPALSAPTPGP